MVPLAKYFRQTSTGLRARSEQPRTAAARGNGNGTVFENFPALAGLPNDDVYLYCKRIDNSRLVRQVDTHAKREVSTIAGACAVAFLIGGLMITPGVQVIKDSYKIQDLKKEQAQLLNERRKLDVQEELMVNAARLEQEAQNHNLVRPAADQVIRLQPKNTSHSFAMMREFKSR